ncbi:hypothetical protein AB1Y20_005635 [Prymnesium parvum]|uniref:Amino acid transporter transmembrane domain-containing protein n=1 Tax=Prymnesium parvum TaxID=97485 RepID=A0AB34J7S4_PRYPA
MALAPLLALLAHSVGAAPATAEQPSRPPKLGILSRPTHMPSRPPLLLSHRHEASSIATRRHKLTTSLIKNIIGAGLFALPAGVAAGVGLGLAIVLTLAIGALSAWTFYALGRASSRTRSATYSQLWERTVGPQTVGVIDTAVVLMAFGACVQYTSTIVQLVGQLLPPRGTPSWLARVLLTSACMLPLVTATDLSALNYSTMIGVAGVGYSALFCCYRLLDRSYGASSPAMSLRLLAPRRGAAVLPFVGSLNTAFMAHLSVPRYWSELESEDESDFASLVLAGFGVSTVACLVFVIVGYLTFGDSCHGLLLDMYAGSDQGARLMRLMTLLSVVGGYPLIFIAMRDSCAAQLRAVVPRVDGKAGGNVKASRDEAAERRSEVLLSVALLVAVTVAAVFAKDVRFLISIRGALLGSVVTFVLPSLVWLHSPLASTSRFANLLSRVLLVYGAISSVVGTIACLLEG